MKWPVDWLSVYRQKDAFWIHDGNPKRPHALLASGRHSNSFFFNNRITEDPRLCHEACLSLVELLGKEIDIGKIDRVVGSAPGAIAIAFATAWHIHQKRKNGCFFAYTEKETYVGKSRMFLKDFVLNPRERVLMTEDVVTTGESVHLAEEAITAAGGMVFPVVLAFVNRSGLGVIDGKKVIALVDHPSAEWSPKECPLCKKGSEAIRPKEHGNWERLNMLS
ncbi:MAG TPA: hypothetical protein VFM02_00340 [Candidatus Paceibacterota bacterium]|nr:hypothetical protein [Candidatus Paceibacterota bacterium]